VSKRAETAQAAIPPSRNVVEDSRLKASEHPEVPELLGDLVSGGGEPDGESHPDVGHESRPHREASEQVVQAVAHEDQVPEGRAAVGGLSVAVMPVEELLDGEEEGEPGEHGDVRCHAPGPGRRLGDHVDDRAPEQGAGSEGHEGTDEPLLGPLIQEQRHRPDEGDGRHPDAAGHDPRQAAHLFRRSPPFLEPRPRPAG
jgi:hypothetical protein